MTTDVNLIFRPGPADIGGLPVHDPMQSMKSILALRIFFRYILEMEPTGAPTDNPAFLDKERAEAIGYVGAPPDELPLFDAELNEPLEENVDGDITPAGKGPSRGYRERWRSIARLHALGLTNNQIGRKLGYSPTGISLALKQPFVLEEVEKFRAAFDNDLASRVKNIASDGLDRIHSIILDDKEKTSIVLDASKWAVEKATGKARQEVTVESGTLSSFMDLLKQMKERNEPLDVTPTDAALLAEGQPEPKSEIDSWLTANL